MRRWLGFALFGWSLWNAVLGVIALFTAETSWEYFIVAAVFMAASYGLWRITPAHHYWGLPKETVAELRRRLGWQFAHLERFIKDGLLPEKFFEDKGLGIDTLGPALSAYLGLLSMDLARAGRAGDAQEAAQTALRLEPNNLPAKLGIIVALAKMDRIAEARPYAESALGQMGPDDEPEIRPVLEDIVHGGTRHLA